MGYYIKEEEFKKDLLKEGDKITILGVSSAMALTTRTEYTYISHKIEERYAQYNDIAILIVKQRNKRKMMGLRLKDSDLILKGWNLDLKTDMETEGTTKVFRGNALINLVGFTDRIKETINNNYVMGEKGIIINWIENQKEEVVFIDRAKEIRYNHAVLNRIMGT